MVNENFSKIDRPIFGDSKYRFMENNSVKNVKLVRYQDT